MPVIFMFGQVLIWGTINWSKVVLRTKLYALMALVATRITIRAIARGVVAADLFAGTSDGSLMSLLYLPLIGTPASGRPVTSLSLKDLHFRPTLGYLVANGVVTGLDPYMLPRRSSYCFGCLFH